MKNRERRHGRQPQGRTLVAAALLALGLALLCGCGEATVCEEGCLKQQSCAKAIDCNKVDPMAVSSCEEQRSQLLNADCSKLSIDGACDGAVKELYESLNSCTLDPTRCTCAN